jgi:hypothetical protein
MILSQSTVANSINLSGVTCDQLFGFGWLFSELRRCEVLHLVMQASAWHENLHICPLDLQTHFLKTIKGAHMCKTLVDTGKGTFVC